MMYCLRKPLESDKTTLEKWKLETILTDINFISLNEKQRIVKYVHAEIEKEYEKYRIIQVRKKDIGCLFVRPYEDGALLSEIYLLEEYRNQGIGTSLIKDVLNQYKIVYLWVYKENIKVISLYEKLGFKRKEETDTRIFMKCIPVS